MTTKSNSTRLPETLSSLRAADSTVWRISVINGPNMPNLGHRDPPVFGTMPSIEHLEDQISEYAATLGVTVNCFHSNFEGEVLEFIHTTAHSCDGYLINPGGMSVRSEAGRHTLAETKKPAVEVHFSNMPASGQRSWFTQSVAGSVMGFREYSYLAGLVALTLALDDETFLNPEGTSPTSHVTGAPISLMRR